MKNRVLVIGVGNRYRRDDGAGPEAARRINKLAFKGVDVVESDGDAATLMELWKGRDAVFLLDAVMSDAPRGTLCRLDAIVQRIPSEAFRCSTHAFGVYEAVELARQMNTLPARLVIFGVEGWDFGEGPGLSTEVESAVEKLVLSVRQELRALQTELKPCMK